MSRQDLETGQEVIGFIRQGRRSLFALEDDVHLFDRKGNDHPASRRGDGLIASWP
jgi:hypothetical protein